MSNTKNAEFMKQFDTGKANQSKPAPMPSQPIGFTKPDGTFVETAPQTKKK